MDQSKYWDLANTVTGAAFIQMMIYMNSLMGNGIDRQRLFDAKGQVVQGILGSFPIYALVLAACAWGECSIGGSETPHTIWLSWFFRVVVVVATTVTSTVATLRLTPDNEKDAKGKRKT